MKKISKGEVIAFTVLLAALIYLAALAAPCWRQTIFDGFWERMKDALQTPFRLKLCANTGGFIAAACCLWIGLAGFYSIKRGNFMRGKEHGSARWATYHELNRLLRQKENIVLTEHVRMGLSGALPPEGHGKWICVLVIGATGKGKTFGYCLPNLLQANTSFAVVDPAGDLLRQTGYFFEQVKGYRVKVINLMDMDAGCQYNPFEYVRDENDVNILVNNFWAATEKKGQTTTDPYWENAPKQLMLALVYYLLETGDVCNFREITTMLSYESGEGREKSPLDLLFDEWEREKPDSLAVDNYKKFARNAAETRRNVVSILDSRLKDTQSPAFQSLTERDTLNMRQLYADAEKKTILYLVIPNKDTTYNFLITIFYVQLFQEIARFYQENGGKRIPSQLRIIMDEFGTSVAAPQDFQGVVADCRKFGYSVDIMLQGLTQLKAQYKDEWESIVGNCAAQLYLGSSEDSTHEWISKRTGQATISTESYGEQKGRGGSYSENRQASGRALLTQDEVRVIGQGGNTDCLLFVQDEYPIRDKRCDPRRLTNYRYTSMGKEGREYTYETMRKKTEKTDFRTIRKAAENRVRPEAVYYDIAAFPLELLQGM